jgi:hypothetical protein
MRASSLARTLRLNSGGRMGDSDNCRHSSRTSSIDRRR